MKIYEVAVKKPVSTILIFIGIVLFGLFSLSKLSIDLYPEIETNTILVFTTYSGASAEDIETNVTRVLEDALNTVSDLKTISSTSRDNMSMITIEFTWGTDIDVATNDVRDKLDMIKQYLPDDAESPIIFKFSTDMIPVMILSATAKESTDALYKILDDRVSNPLNRINGVGTVSVTGAPKREVHVNVDPQKLEAYNLTVEQIGGIIAAENLIMPAGTFDIGSNTYSLRIDGEFDVSDEMKRLVVGSYNGQNIYMTDVAVVKDTLEERAQESYTNGIRSATIIIQKQSGANTVDIAKKVTAALPALQKDLPADVELSVIMDTSEFIVDSINSLTETVILAGIFVMVVVLFFLGRWRATIIIILTIPISLVASFVYLMVSGNTINIISLSSLTIAIGMVVDDAIVVLENITTHLERGSKPREAAIYGTNEVGVAVMASTLTIIAVFLPFTMVSGLAGIMFQQLGWMVTIIITMSVICALTLTPMLSAYMLKGQSKEQKESKIYAPIRKMLDGLDNWYAGILNWAVRHRLVVVLGAVAIFVSSLFLLSRVGSEFIPESDNGQITATIELPIGTRVEFAKEAAAKIQNKFSNDFPEIEAMTYTVGQASSDNTFAAMQDNGTHIITMRMRFGNASDRDRSIFEMAEQMRLYLETLPELVKYQISTAGGSGFDNAVDIEIYGYDFETTDKLAAEIKEKTANVPGFRDIRISREEYRPEYQIDFDREKLALYGLNMSTVSSFVRNRINGLTASQFREDGEEYDIIVRYDEKFRQSIEDIENIMVYNNLGQGLRVRELGMVVERFSPPSIERENRERVVKVSGSIYDAALSDVVAGINAELAQITIPDGIGVNIGGTWEDQQESFGDLGTLLVLVIVLVYIVMASQFESFKSPFIIMLSLPFAFTGVFLALWLTNTTLNMLSMIGAIMLVGIVVKNGIVLIDYINLNRERGTGLIPAVVAGGKSRLRPVLMTTMTTILGMLPMALKLGEGSEMWQPMGIAIIGGLTISTILTLIVVPVVYTIFGAGDIKKERKRFAAELKEMNLEEEQ
ncbi:MAG: efflux RND transporter permease subunit [Bacteroidales bacterium]|jgi:HAE1 family hydrophobic/amphiphilic exporter-1|nr:efflux RND transporter permease subunit [Bacteroidales bacterium]